MMKMSLLALFAISRIAIPRPSAGGSTAGAPGVVRYVVAADGNEARYRVREQLMHHDLPTVPVRQP
jgi:hypothetical protein